MIVEIREEFSRSDEALDDVRVTSGPTILRPRRWWAREQDAVR